MVRKNIFEILEEKYNVITEHAVICELFKSPLLITGGFLNPNEPVTIEQAVNDNCFYAWKQRGACISVNDMLKKLDFQGGKTLTPKGRICQLEYFCNIIQLANTRLSANAFRKLPQMVILEDNINILIDHLGYEKHIFKEQEKVILVPKNPAATAVAEISSEDTAMAILQYHHASLKGKLAEKKDILRRIAQEYEPLLDKPIDGYTEYFKTANNMLNNLDIRHNNKAGKKKNALVTSLTNEELENWYDELYQLLLFCVLIKDNKDRKDKIAEFLKGLQEKKS